VFFFFSARGGRRTGYRRAVQRPSPRRIFRCGARAVWSGFVVVAGVGVWRCETEGARALSM